MALKFDSSNTIIGEGSVFEGKFYVNGSIQISGKFEGEIHTDNHVIINESGKVRTNIRARKVTIGGTLIGNVQATEEVLMLTSGKCIGNIATPNLILQKGAVTKGDITITGGQEDDIGKLVKESFDSTPGFEHFTKKKGGSTKSKKAGKAKAAPKAKE